MISTAYSLPFRVWHSERVFSSGQPVEIVLRLVNQGDLPGLQEVVSHFSALAATGAVSGDKIAPWETAFVLDRVIADPGGNLRFVIERALLADEAVLVLSHMLLAAHKRTPIEYVEILSTTHTSRQLLTSYPEKSCTYPRLFERLPFSVDNLEPEGGAYTFYIQLEQPLDAQHEKQLNSALMVWARSILLGGYALAPIDPEKSYVEPDTEEVITYGTVIEWAVFKLRADSASIDAFVNILAAFHVRCQAIRYLEIS